MTSGGEALIKALADENVDIIFGYPGGAALHIYDAIYQQDRVQHILVRHEQAATHAADGFARATGKPRFTGSSSKAISCMSSGLFVSH